MAAFFRYAARVGPGGEPGTPSVPRYTASIKRSESDTDPALIWNSYAHLSVANCELTSSAGDVVRNLHLQEEPFRVASEDIGQLGPEIAGGLAKSVHDSAQGSLVNAEHPGKAVLPNAGGVHSELQIRVDVSI